MKLSEIVADLKSLKDTVAGFISDKTKATAEALTSFQSKLSSLESGTVAELTAAQTELAQSKSDLATAKQTIGTLEAAKTDLTAQLTAEQAKVTTLTAEKTDLSGKVTTLSGEITAQTTALRSHLATVPGHADYKDGGSKAGATLAELVAAEQNATNTALASLNIPRKDVPAAPAQSTATTPKMTRKEFEALEPKAQTAFFKSGGKVIPNPAEN